MAGGSCHVARPCTCDSHLCCFCFFQAEDGIRDYKVTGVQTCALPIYRRGACHRCGMGAEGRSPRHHRSEEHTSELQSPCNLVCRLLLEKKHKHLLMSHHAPSLRPVLLLRRYCCAC